MILTEKDTNFDILDFHKENSLSKKKELISNLISDILTKIIGEPEGGKWKETENFFDSGIDSLSSLYFVDFLNQKMKLQLSSSILYQFPSIEELKEYLYQELVK